MIIKRLLWYFRIRGRCLANGLAQWVMCEDMVATAQFALPA